MITDTKLFENSIGEMQIDDNIDELNILMYQYIL